MRWWRRDAAMRQTAEVIREAERASAELDRLSSQLARFTDGLRLEQAKAEHRRGDVAL